MKVNAYGIINRKKIIKLREEKDLTQAELADKMGVSRKFICDIEGNNYSNPCSLYLAKLAIFFKLPMEDFLNKKNIVTS